MKDIITYCPDLNALKQSLIDAGQVDDDGSASITAIKTPVQYSQDGIQTLALVRCMTADDEASLAFGNLELLGTYDEVFADEDKMAKYTSIYSLDPVTWQDEDGNDVTFTPPQKFGVFA